MEPEDVRKRRPDDVHRAQVDGADEDARQQRRHEEDQRGRQPQAGARGTDHALRRSAFPTACTKLTMRGPQRDATESSMPITRWLRTAHNLLHPGQLATVA